MYLTIPWIIWSSCAPIATRLSIASTANVKACLRIGQFYAGSYSRETRKLAFVIHSVVFLFISPFAKTGIRFGVQVFLKNVFAVVNLFRHHRSHPFERNSS